jgi:hypothetical protein
MERLTPLLPTVTTTEGCLWPYKNQVKATSQKGKKKPRTAGKKNRGLQGRKKSHARQGERLKPGEN